MTRRLRVDVGDRALVRSVASWLEKHVLLRLTRQLGTRHGQPRADVPLYWLSKGLGLLAQPETIRRVRVNGYHVALPIGDPGLRLTYLIGHYERDVEQLAAATLRPGDVAVDVGANIGWHTLHFASAVGPRGHVFSFEPAVKPRALLTNSVRLNGWMSRITIRADAVSDHIGAGNLYLDRSAGLMSALRPHDWLETTRPATVPVTTLDHGLMPYLDRPLRLLKIDVEGLEHEVLCGAARMFRDMPPAFVILEISSIRDAAPVLEFMQAHGYAPVSLVHGRLRQTSLSPPPPAAQVGGPLFEYRNVCFRHHDTDKGGRHHPYQH